MKLSDLVASRADGSLSHTKLWTNIAYLVASAIVLVQAYRGTLAPDVLLIYLAVVGGHGIASKWISVRYQGNESDKDTQP